MSTPIARSAPRPDAATPAEFLALGPVELRVTDADRAVRFWRLVGLIPVSAPAGAVALGIDGRPLVVLRQTVARPAAAGHTGLYHAAVHFPSEREFARVLARLTTARWPVSPVDHLFSKAIYLRDPDGIGVELALETPWRMREMGADPVRCLYAVDQQGQVHRPSEPLDVPALLALATGTDIMAAADGAFIGHIHLSVPDLDAAVGFYRDQLGMIEHLNVPALGFADLHAGGAFTHRIALNTFPGPDAPPTPIDMAGVERLTIRYTAIQRLQQATATRWPAHAMVKTGSDSAHAVDPGGNRIDLLAAGPAR